MSFYAYILLCFDGSYYAGHTDDMDARLASHEQGMFDGYTKSRRPVKLMWVQEFETRYEALSAERQIKGWTRAKKRALIEGKWDLLRLLPHIHGSARERSRP